MELWAPKPENQEEVDILRITETVAANGQPIKTVSQSCASIYDALIEERYAAVRNDDGTGALMVYVVKQKIR